MKVQLASMHETNLLRDVTAATEGHSFHTAAATFPSTKYSGVESGRLRPGGYLTSLGLGLPKDQLLLQKVTSTTVPWHGLTRRTGLLG